MSKPKISNLTKKQRQKLSIRNTVKGMISDYSLEKYFPRGSIKSFTDPSATLPYWQRTQNKVESVIEERNDLISFFSEKNDGSEIELSSISVYDALEHVDLDDDHIVLLQIGNDRLLLKNKSQIDKIVSRKFESILEIEQENEGSDEQYIINLKRNPSLTVKFLIYEKKEGRLQGAWFPYLSKMFFDLSSIGIFNHIPNKYSSSCKFDLSDREIDLIEKFDYNILEFIVNNFKLIQKMRGKDHVEHKMDRLLVRQGYSSTESHLLAYFLNSQKHPKGYNFVHYSKRGGNKGRLYPEKSLSLISLPTDIRHTLCSDYYVDLDIYNCQPSLLLFVFVKFGYSHKYLKEYVCNREKILCDLITLNHPDIDIKNKSSSDYQKMRDNMKKLIIKLINYGKSAIKKIKRTPWLSSFYQEVTDNVESFVCNHLKSELEITISKTERIKLKDPTYTKNPIGSVISIYCQELENSIINLIFNFYKKNEIISNECVLCFDGLMLPIIDNYDYVDDIPELEYIVREELGITIKLKIKPMTEKLDLSSFNILPFVHEKDDCSHIKFSSYNKNCLYRAFETLKMPKQKLLKFATMFRSIKNEKDVYLPTKSLNEISSQLGITIKLNRPKKDGTSRTEYYPQKNKINKSNPVYNIGLYEDHYFAITDFPISSYALDNYFDLCNVPMKNSKPFTNITGIRPNGNYIHESNPKTSSLVLVKKLLSDKSKYLTKITKTTKNFNKTIEYKTVKNFDLLEYDYNDYKPITIKNDGVGYQCDDDGEPLMNFDEVVYFDFECFTDTPNHEAYEIWAKRRKTKQKYHFVGLNCAMTFLESLTDLKECYCIAHNLAYDFNCIIRYLSGIRNYIKSGKMVKCVTGTYTSPITGLSVKLKLKDSYSQIPMTLKEFTKTYGIEAIKESMPYEIYTKTNVLNKKSVKISEALSCLKTEKDKNRFLSNIKRWNLLTGEDEFNHMEYSSKYCEQDVDVLEQGYETQRRWTLEETKFDIDHLASLPQLAFKYGVCEGCFEGCYKFSGIPREFMSLNVDGGRSMTYNNEKFKVRYDENIPTETYYEEEKDYGIFDIKSSEYNCKTNKFEFPNTFSEKVVRDCLLFSLSNMCRMTKERILRFFKLKYKDEPKHKLETIINQLWDELIPKNLKFEKNKTVLVYNMKLNDLDAVSLYPSAMERLGRKEGGFLMGLPTPFYNDMTYAELLTKDGFIAEIEIISVGKQFGFPLISGKDEDGIRRYSNECCRMVVDKFKLKDLIKYQKINFDIIKGYYFNSGRNNRVASFMRKLFEKRRKAKKENNKKQSLYKLIMNSFYGKTIMKPRVRKTNFIDGYDKYLKFCSYNYNQIISVCEYSPEKYVFTCEVPVINHYSAPHIGSEILSLSKRIMNEVLCLAEDLKIKMFITDTDSTHIDDSKVQLLSDVYRKKFKKELIGNDLGQFHCDFSKEIDELSTEDTTVKSDIIPYAIESIFLGKKCYIDKVVLQKDGKKYYQYHARMKSIPGKCLLEDDNDNLS